jgi:hypothetical protein
VDDEQRRIEINWVQAAAGALAAMSSAVLLSTVGVAGTVIGAAVGSVVVTVGNAVYSHYLQVSRERVAAAQLTARLRVERAREDLRGAAVDLGHDPEHAGDRLDRAGRELGKAQRELGTAEATPESVGWRDALSGLPWKRLAVIAAALFVVAMLVIVSFELITGRAVSTYTGGTDDRGARTSVPGLGGSDQPARRRTDTPSPTPTTDVTPSPASQTPAPSAAPTTSAPVEPTSSQPATESASPTVEEPTPATETTTP